jgi:hypothetical protein
MAVGLGMVVNQSNIYSSVTAIPVRFVNLSMKYVLFFFKDNYFNFPILKRRKSSFLFVLNQMTFILL